VAERPKIICPGCGKHCQPSSHPVAWYRHECEHCGYVITESEWEEVPRG